MKKNNFNIFILLAILYCYSCTNKQNNKIEGETKTSSLPKINLYYYRTKPNKKVSCTFVLNDEFVLHGKIKNRGGSSIGYAKKSYTLTLPHKASILGIPESKKWILNACYIDKSLMRNKLCYDLYKSFDKNNIAPEVRFVDFYHDKQYDGIYQLTQKIDAVSLKFDLDKKVGMIFKDCAVFTERYFPPQEKDSYYQQTYPKVSEIDYTVFMDSLKSFILFSPEEEFIAKVDSIFDTDNLIEWHILIMLSNNGDGVYKNYYLYKKDEFSKFKIVPWDYDATFGRDTDNELNMMKTSSHWERNKLLERLFKLNANKYQDRLKNRWKQLRENGKISKKTLLNKVEQYKQAIEVETERNFKRWPVTDEHYYDSATFEQEIEIIKKFIDLRIDQLDEKLK